MIKSHNQLTKPTSLFMQISITSKHAEAVSKQVNEQKGGIHIVLAMTHKHMTDYRTNNVE